MSSITDLEIPKVNFDTNGELIIVASPTSSKHDFDFYEGKCVNSVHVDPSFRDVDPSAKQAIKVRA